MSSHLGIVVCSRLGAPLCFEILSNEASVFANAVNARPEISMHADTLSDYVRAIDAGKWNGVAGLMLSSARKLATKRSTT